MTTTIDTTTAALTALVTAAEIMSKESRKAQQRNRRTYGTKFDAASRQHLNACYWLQANDRETWDEITADRTVSTDMARKLIDAAGR